MGREISLGGRWVAGRGWVLGEIGWAGAWVRERYNGLQMGWGGRKVGEGHVLGREVGWKREMGWGGRKVWGMEMGWGWRWVEEKDEFREGDGLWR